MNDRHADRAEAVRQIAAILAAAYVRMRSTRPIFSSVVSRFGIDTLWRNSGWHERGDGSQFKAEEKTDRVESAIYVTER